MKHGYKYIMNYVRFRITAKRSDFIQGLCTSVTVKFSKDSKHYSLIAPKFWGQAVFYLDKP